MTKGLKIGINAAKLVAAIPKGITVKYTGDPIDTIEEAAAVASDVIENISAALTKMSSDPKICLLLANGLNLLPKEDTDSESDYSFEVDKTDETVQQKTQDNQNVFGGADLGNILGSIIGIAKLFKK